MEFMLYFAEDMEKFVEETLPAIRSRVYTVIGTLDAEAWTTGEPVPFENRRTGVYKKLGLHDNWGKLWDCAWFRFEGRIPAGYEKRHLVALIDVSGEGCIFDEQGCPVQGLTCVEADYEKKMGMTGKRVFPLDGWKIESGQFELWMDAGCNDLFGRYYDGGTLRQADLAVCNDRVRELFYDFQTLLDLMRTVEPKSARHNRLLSCLYEASTILHDYGTTEIERAESLLKPELERKAGEYPLVFSAIGHAHIDLAWLWPIRETIRKGARTFATVLKLMESYPDYIFGASQPQLYQWMKERYPALYTKIKERVQEGRWEVQGAMWVEADTNLVSGESLVRQILYGKRFFQQEFGVDVQTLWLPDAFGYSAALPQIMKKSGVRYFMTQKLSWNAHNKFPYHTFWWEGIDGSRVLTHMLPEETYNGPATPSSTKLAEENYTESGISANALMLFGIGDGGGGPGREHLERLKRMQNLAGIAPVRQEQSLALFKRLEAGSEKYPKWSGELYLEKHQGTYTSQSENKRYNRLMELSLRELEFAMVLSGLCTAEMKAELDAVWKEVLLYQFHDILPGSSIKRVYDESLERYKVLQDRTDALCTQCYLRAASGLSGTVAFNSLSWDRWEWLEQDGKFVRLNVPALGFAPLSEGTEAKPQVKAGGLCIENECLRVTFGESGAITGLYDKGAQREALSGYANVLDVYGEERCADAWDINTAYLDTQPDVFRLVKQAAYVEGVTAVMEQMYTYGKSSISLLVKLVSGREYVDFDMQVDWQESLKMLRTAFPVRVRAGQASYEIQFGKIERATNENTSWDRARFETCGQKWVDISQPDYGVALLNTGKYGYRIAENVIDMDLLRSQNTPGAAGDIGRHSIRYALYPHEGNEITGEVSKKAYEYNIPIKTETGTGTDSRNGSLLTLQGNVVVDTIKPSEDTKAVVIRLFEPYGQHVRAVIKPNRLFREVSRCDLLENAQEKLEKGMDGFSVDVRPFEIITLRFER